MEQALTLDKAVICYYFYHTLHSLAGISGFGKISNRVLDILVVANSEVAAFQNTSALNCCPEIFYCTVFSRLNQPLPQANNFAL